MQVTQQITSSGRIKSEESKEANTAEFKIQFQGSSGGL
jgi:hypothetical protein